MRRAVLPLLGIFFATMLVGCGPRNPRVDVVTQFGTIRVEVDSARAPLTAANFLRYVDEGRYANASFYRVRGSEAELMQQRNAIVQGGLYMDDDTTKLLPPIGLESTQTTGLRHTDGTVSMARFGVNSARAEFFIVVGDQPHLDYRDAQRQGYAAFGRVVDGMELVEQISKLPAQEERIARPIPFRVVRVK
ncbi:peptidylprolyl isomerase [Longimicrobium sp.]|uniref:peptidylprolyl isomerase n=1 Tax=Longimicrobium sp. TaxID=2029185 RepID=UPI002E2FA348|nr:peptidylprolyl isomerase [Longimicrobium sp.]HEX6037559.1 peptidylprolyl isomerase [Longimicrobium sp.]